MLPARFGMHRYLHTQVEQRINFCSRVEISRARCPRRGPRLPARGRPPGAHALHDTVLKQLSYLKGTYSWAGDKPEMSRRLASSLASRRFPPPSTRSYFRSIVSSDVHARGVHKGFHRLHHVLRGLCPRKRATDFKTMARDAEPDHARVRDPFEPCLAPSDESYAPCRALVEPAPPLGT